MTLSVEPMALTRKGQVMLGREVQAQIGEQLNAMYAEFLNYELPENLRELLRRLDEPQAGAVRKERGARSMNGRGVRSLFSTE